MRLFYAAFLGSENMQAYEVMVAGIASAVPRVLRPIPDRSHHLTMAFVGEIDESELGACREALTAIEGWRAFDYSLARPRILYARRAPRLVCADVTDGADQIAALQAQLRDAFIQRFPKFQLRAQSPHVTLARFKRNAHPQTATPVSEALAELPSSALPRSDRLVSIQLVESDLTPSGPVYRRLAEATP